jgi:hypothetical protein
MRTTSDGNIELLSVDPLPVVAPRPRLARSPGATVGQRAKPLRALIRRRPRASGLGLNWVLELEPDAEPFVKPLLGWVGVRVPLGGMQLEFPTKADAVAFAERHGWSIEIVAPQWPVKTSGISIPLDRKTLDELDSGAITIDGGASGNLLAFAPDGLADEHAHGLRA